MSKKASKPDKKIDFDALIKEMKNSIETHLKEMLSKMFNNSDERLFELADSASTNAAQNRYFELMRNVRELKQEVSDDFIADIHLLLCPFAEFNPDTEKNGLDEDRELSLIGQDEMEDMVMIKSVSSDASGKFREAISHLEARLEHLALKTPEIFAKKALDPVYICKAFDKSVGKHFKIDNKKILFELFNTDVASKLDVIYDASNNLLIAADVLPQIKLHASKSADKKRPTPTTELPDDNTEDDDQINQGGYAMTATPGHTNRGGGSAGSGGGSGAGQQGGGGAGRSYGGDAGQQGGGDSGGGYGGGTGQQGGAGGGYGGGAGQQGGGDSGEGYGGGAGQQGGGNSGEGYGGGTGQQGGGDSGGGYGSGAGQQGSGGAGGGYGGGTGQQGGGGGGYDGDAGQQGGSAGGGYGGGGSQQGDTSQGNMGAKGAENASGSGNYHHNTAGMPANQVSQALGNYLGSPIQPGAASENEGGSDAYPAATPQHYGHSDILGALSGLQIQSQFNDSGELKFDGEAIKQALLTEIAKTSGGVVTKRINHIAEKTIDFIELIFDAIIEDDDISDTIKALLLRLQIPVIKASMVDQEFFIYDDHPARLLLDKIAEVGIGVTDHDDEIYIELEKIITKLVTEFELQTSSFEEALDALNAFVDERDEVARKQEEETQYQVLREHARNTVLKSLRSTTRGKTLPESTHALVLKRWPTLMYNHYLNYGKENDEWVSIVETLRDLIISIQPLHSADDLQYLLNTKDDLIEKALEYLNKTNQSEKDIEKVINGLTDVYQQHIDAANFEEIDTSKPGIQLSDIKPAERTPEPIEEEPPGPPLPRNIIPGMWYQIYMGEEKINRRGKLSVIIVQDSKLVFVNYQGGIIVEKTFEDFIDEMEKGTSKSIMGHSVFDHALNRVVKDLNK